MHCLSNGGFWYYHSKLIAAGRQIAEPLLEWILKSRVFLNLEKSRNYEAFQLIHFRGFVFKQEFFKKVSEKFLNNLSFQIMSSNTYDNTILDSDSSTEATTTETYEIVPRENQNAPRKKTRVELLVDSSFYLVPINILRLKKLVKLVLVLPLNQIH
ncbi:hypothetical protein BpHYR1_024665 [Brachionus plicatilis]|uniref:Uncharacterized protein n=1 Tax=Brachionus plicatilis TaxID=10195 RepID=A0A3M7PPW8_BRAPC|nr:hypothetical protein BpHYR1_024665 [Brachionus plicatilis]